MSSLYKSTLLALLIGSLITACSGGGDPATDGVVNMEDIPTGNYPTEQEAGERNLNHSFIRLEDGAPDAFLVPSPTEAGGYYAGITPGTSLGAPIEFRQGEATWEGEVAFFYRLTTVDTTATFTVNYGTSIINAIVSFSVNGNPNYGLSLVAGYNPAGRLTGHSDILHTSCGNNGRCVEGDLIGLIGQEGAIGVFTGNMLAGGFLAYSP